MGIGADAKPHIETRPRTGGGDAYDHGDIKKPGNDASKNQIGFFLFQFFDLFSLWLVKNRVSLLKAGIMNLKGDILFLSSTLRISQY